MPTWRPGGGRGHSRREEVVEAGVDRAGPRNARGREGAVGVQGHRNSRTSYARQQLHHGRRAPVATPPARPSLPRDLRGSATASLACSGGRDARTRRGQDMDRRMNRRTRGALVAVLTVILGLPGAPALAAPPISRPTRPHGAADPGADLSADHRARRPQGRRRRRVFEVKAPAGRPNVLIVLIDDMGFGMSSAFGGPIHMPTVDRLASERAPLQPLPHHGALLADAHRAAHRPQPPHATTWGRSPRRPPPSRATRASGPTAWRRSPRCCGSTATAPASSARTTRPRPGRSARPARPTAGPPAPGFDKFYGFIGGETNQWAPLVYDGLTPVEVPKDPNYHFMTDMTDQAIAWVQVPEVAHARQAVLHVLRAGRHPRAAPRPEGVDREVQGQVRPGLGHDARGDAGPPDQARRRARRTRSSPPSRRPSRTGTRSRPTRRSSSPARWRSSPASASTPTPRSAGSSTPSRRWASSTTRSSSTSSATTARAPRAA